MTNPDITKAAEEAAGLVGAEVFGSYLFKNDYDHAVSVIAQAFSGFVSKEAVLARAAYCDKMYLEHTKLAAKERDAKRESMMQSHLALRNAYAMARDELEKLVKDA